MENANREIEKQLPRTLAIIKKIDELPGLTWHNGEFARHHNNGERIKTGRKKSQKNSYKHWMMPEQPEGYIKPRKNDFL
jgi:hypothetical protein